MSWEELEKLNKEYLDTLNLDKYVNESNDVQTIIDMIEDVFNDKECLPPELEGCIFDHLGTEDIAYYLADRYGKRVYEQVIYQYTINSFEILLSWRK